MNVHLIKDSELSLETYSATFDLLCQVEGSINYIAHFEDVRVVDLDAEDIEFTKDEFERQDDEPFACYSVEPFSEFPITRSVSTPKEILKECSKFRYKKDIGDNEIVVLLTETTNSLNWFKYGMSNNAFINTSDFSYFVPCDSSYPLAAQITSLVMQMLMFDDLNHLLNSSHKERSIGCINDFCENKHDILLQFKTADICIDCQKIIKDAGVSNKYVKQIIETLESLRSKMLAIDKYKRSLGSSPIKVDKESGNIIIVDLDNYMIKLTPLEKTVYQFFLGHPEGIFASEIQDYEYEIKELYNEFSAISDFQKHNKYIGDLLSPMTNSMQEKLSKIRKKFRDVLGPVNYRDYVVSKDEMDGKYKIRLDRDLIKV
jgi:hypothetical protein